MTLCEFENFY